MTEQATGTISLSRFRFRRPRRDICIVQVDRATLSRKKDGSPLIARETRNVAPPPVNVTLRWFYENRFLPQKEEQWKVTSRPKTKRFIENYLLKRFGDFLLVDLDKFTLQTYLNELAPNFSKSVLAKTRVYLNSMLGEAVELEFLPKNPAAKLVVPRSGKKAANQPLTPEQIPQVLFHLGRPRPAHRADVSGARPASRRDVCVALERQAGQ